MKTKLITTIACLLLAAGTQAQQIPLDVAALINRHTSERVRLLQDYITKLTSKNTKQNMKQRYRQYALDLFINQGNPYDEIAIDRDTGEPIVIGQNTGAKIIFTSKSNPTPRTELVRDFLTRIMDSKSNKKITITAMEVADIDVSDMRRVADGHYVCTANFVQRIIVPGHGEDTEMYQDITRRRAMCHVYAEETAEGMEYIIPLGNVYAVIEE